MRPRNDPPGAEVLSISEVERQTGIRPATLRMWERRYGFPQPLRDRHGDRVYPPNQVERLHAARRLMAQGVRPGKIFAAGTALQAAGTTPLAAAPDALALQFQPVFDLLRHYRLAALHCHFQHRLLDLGLRRFVIEFLGPLSTAVGFAWGRGELPMRCGHLYAQVAMSFLHARQAAVRAAGGGQGPKVVLATPTGEVHGLGIMMVEAVLTTLGAECVQLGTDVPPPELAAAAAETGADIVALSFSAYFPRKSAARAVTALRAALPPGVALWVGGDGAPDAADMGAGLELFNGLAAIEPALQRWRSPSGAETADSHLHRAEA